MISSDFPATFLARAKLHGGQKHSMGPQSFTRWLHRQLSRNRNHGFEQLRVCGRTGTSRV
ncbi:unnamed protein product [Penicillium roqueforti FM164]|uniref:Genomic scaffold, ProqFM164S02 n=1 Tax=Penicillium roqueforti (strain FM164) TaxID=1365484 RepID=W6Q8S7_PENRF|nr:unnamed protein product [Penicillium roqueforti FM164]